MLTKITKDQIEQEKAKGHTIYKVYLPGEKITNPRLAGISAPAFHGDIYLADDNNPPATMEYIAGTFKVSVKNVSLV